MIEYNSASALSDLLSEITVKLQLDATRYEKAVSAYKHVGRYLESNTPAGVWLAIGPQGSMRIHTTVRPRGGGEFDLDIVIVLRGVVLHITAQQLYNWGLNTLARDAFFGPIIEKMNRCVRLNYADFHLDLLFAILDPNPQTSATSILVPDRKLRGYTNSDPEGYAVWFDGQCAIDTLVRKRYVALKQAPLPSNDPAHLKALLKRIVQLIKRARDVHFDGHEAAPRSVVITTLAARNYLGAATLYEGLLTVMEQIVYEIESAEARGEQLVVRNPTNQLEEFSEKWREKPADYAIAVGWMIEFRDRLRALATLTGPSLDRALEALFGERVVHEARLSVAQRFDQQRRAGQVRTTGRSLTTSATIGGTIVPPHTFHGGDDE